jgi:DNA-binding response OmpR family regulator
LTIPNALADVLVVEDDEDVRETTTLLLERQGLRVAAFATGDAAWQYAVSEPPALALVDIAMPGMNGLTLTRKLVSRGVPVVLLTARDLAADVVQGFELGAVDYITKPFDAEVLLARVRNALARAISPQAPTVYQHGDTTIDLAAHTASTPSGMVAITPTEVRILRLLIENRGHVVSSGRFLTEVWGEPADFDTQILATNIQRLRNKLGSDVIVTARGYGYRIAT